jgi:hypothetical protein
MDAEIANHLRLAEAVTGAELVLGNPVGVQSTREGALVEDGYAETSLPELGCTGKARRAGADAGYTLVELGAGAEGKLATGFVIRLDCESLQSANLDRLLPTRVHHACAFAEHLNGAYAAATCTKDVGVEDRASGAGDIAGGYLFNKSRDIDVRRACAHAGGIKAVQASMCFHGGLPCIEGLM